MMSSNFEKITKTNKKHSEGYKRHKKTQPRGGSQKRNWS